MQFLPTAVRPAAMAWVALTILFLAGCGQPNGDTTVAEGDSGAPAPGQVVAEVNGVPIEARQLESLCQAERLRVEARGEPVDEAAIRQSALDLLIHGELLVQAARASGLEIDPSALDEQLQVAHSQFESDEAFQAYLRSAGLDEEAIRRDAERRLLMERYVQSRTGDLGLDEAEARTLYEQQRERYRDAEQLRAAHILVRLRSEDDDEVRAAARRRIDEAHRRAMAGESFEALAREYSDSPLAAAGGDLGFFPRGRLMEAFEAVVFQTPVGEITPVFETPLGFNVVKVLDRREARVKPFEEVRTQVLMVLAREQRDEALQAEVRRLCAEAEIEVHESNLEHTAGH